MGMDLVIRKREGVGLHQPGKNGSRLCQTEGCTDTRPWTTSKGDVGKRRGLAAVGKTLGAERFGVFPYAWVAVREINRVEHSRASGDAVTAIVELHLLRDAPVADVDWRI